VEEARKVLAAQGYPVSMVDNDDEYDDFVGKWGTRVQYVILINTGYIIQCQAMDMVASITGFTTDALNAWLWIGPASPERAR
jgi:hypothetical protein